MRVHLGSADFCAAQLSWGLWQAVTEYVMQAARAEKLASAAQQHPLWLSFRDKDLERNFAAWHSLQLQKVSTSAYLLGVVCAVNKLVTV